MPHQIPSQIGRRREKSRQTKKSISALKNNQGNIVSDASAFNSREKLLPKCVKTYWTRPFRNKQKIYINETKIDHSLSNTIGGQCTNALFNMKLKKSPGLSFKCRNLSYLLVKHKRICSESIQYMLWKRRSDNTPKKWCYFLYNIFIHYH